MKKDIPAFPTVYLNNYSGNVESANGLTKREVFAMAAMQGILSNADWTHNGEPKHVASSAIAFADELLKQLEN